MTVLPIPPSFERAWPLLLLSGMISTATIYVLVALTERIRAAAGAARWFWFVTGTITLSIGLWASLLLGLLSLRLPLPYTLDPLRQFFAFPLIGALAAICLAAISQRPGRSGEQALAALAIGLGSLFLHVLLISSVRMSGRLVIPPVLLTGGVLVCLSGTLAGLWGLTRVSTSLQTMSWNRRIAALMSMGPVVTAVQQGVISLARFVPDPALPAPTRVVDTLWLAAPVTMGSLATLALTGLMAASERRVLAFITSLTERSDDGLFTVDRRSILRYMNPRAREILCPGCKPIGRNAWEVLPARFAEAMSEQMRRLMQTPDNVEYETYDEATGAWYEVLINPWPDFCVFILRDITQRKRLEAQIRHQALHDPLTNLTNRTLFRERVEHSLAAAREGWKPAAVLFLDLDDFKMVNDSFGHSAGDELLAILADRLTACVGPEATVARLGGDEFAVLVEQVCTGEVLDMADRMMAAVQVPIRLGDITIEMTASVGIALSTSETESAEELLRNADTAMYSAKGAGKAACRLFDTSMYDAVRTRMELRHDLARALQRDELVLYYQPIISLTTGRVECMEALVRWNHPVRGLLGPCEFIGLAEESGLIYHLGEWVLHTACRQARLWQDELGWQGAPSVSVNLSPRQLERAGISEQVALALRSAGLGPGRLTLEITEGSLLRGSRTLQAELAACKRLGVHLAIDDFGTGYSSLAYLHQYPFDTVKLDKAFLSASLTDDRTRRLVRGIIQLAAELHLETVAEGVEREEQASALRAVGCTRAQGFLFARPAPAADTAYLLGIRPAAAR